jgi:hypothetical protein
MAPLRRSTHAAITPAESALRADGDPDCSAEAVAIAMPVPTRATAAPAAKTLGSLMLIPSPFDRKPCFSPQ